ncbi:hypothetical protein SKAU_G00061540 [Synaphobranchus kaupii]|uniref:Gypsy retrotransposon integrase-like protein 1 n=1 Tax=Synaphobranchus kaupii TaxID=118154 RepID=A0A9Q1G4Z5_SYNKA|nr:hypothetical protein SKAU_G00061540 [Synaphobranchus kaupii]
MDPALRDVLTAVLQTQQTLQKAVTELCSRTAKKTPEKVLTKLTAEDDVEAYLELFERIATREGWPRAEWAHILTPFLSGEAQQACRDLAIADAANYAQLKSTILAQYGYSLPAKAQRVRQWTYDTAGPARPQVKALQRQVKMWLTEGEGPSPVDRVVLDMCVRALPTEAKKYVAQQGAPDVDRLIALLENHQVTQKMMRATSNPPKTEKTGTSPRVNRSPYRRGMDVPQGTRGGRSLQRNILPQNDRRCFGCGKEGHFARDCPERTEPMPTAGSAPSPFPCGYLTAGWAETCESAPRFPVKIQGRDTEALLDSGSGITLVRPEFVEGPHGDPVVVSCIHGDDKSYPTSLITIHSPKGTVSTRVGVVPGLPVPVLIGRDCSLFSKYWGIPQAAKGVRRKKPPRTHLVCAAPSKESQSSPDDADRPRANRSGRKTSAIPRVQEQGAPSGSGGSDDNLPFSEFMQVHSGQPEGATEFSRAPAPRSQPGANMESRDAHHCGTPRGEKTYERLTMRFYWPGIKKAVEDYCRHCAECQLHSPKVTYRNPLIPLPIIDIPFKRIGMDIVGPLPKSSRGHRYILVILDYATRYPEAIPLRTATGKTVAKELFMLCSRVGIPEDILTDQGSCFMSNVMKALCQLMKVKQVRTSVYHPQTDGLVERFNKTLKQMMRKLIESDAKDWDQLLPYLLFSVHEVPQASTGFSPFELLYGRRPRGLLDLAKEAWEQQPTRHTTVIEHVEKMHRRMAQIWPTVREHMHQAQEAQARLYNRGAQVREFQPGDKVLVLVPTQECKFLAKWHGPYEVVEKITPVNYTVRQMGRRQSNQIYHINLLKRWYEPSQVPVRALSTNLSSTTPPDVPMGKQLSPHQVQELKELISRNRDVFSDQPGRTNVIAHDIITEPGKKVRLRRYRIPETRREAVRDEAGLALCKGLPLEDTSWAGN